MSIVSNENKEMLWDLIIDICNDNGFKVNGEELKGFLDEVVVITTTDNDLSFQIII